MCTYTPGQNNRYGQIKFKKNRAMLLSLLYAWAVPIILTTCVNISIALVYLFCAANTLPHTTQNSCKHKQSQIRAVSIFGIANRDRYIVEVYTCNEIALQFIFAVICAHYAFPDGTLQPPCPFVMQVLLYPNAQHTHRVLFVCATYILPTTPCSIYTTKKYIDFTQPSPCITLRLVATP